MKLTWNLKEKASFTVRANGKYGLLLWVKFCLIQKDTEYSSFNVCNTPSLLKTFCELVGQKQLSLQAVQLNGNSWQWDQHEWMEKVNWTWLTWLDFIFPSSMQILFLWSNISKSNSKLSYVYTALLFLYSNFCCNKKVRPFTLIQSFSSSKHSHRYILANLNTP